MKTIAFILLISIIATTTADLSSWTEALREKNKGKVAQEMAQLSSLVQEAIGRDDALRGAIDPLDRAFNAYAWKGEEPNPEEISSLIDSLPAKVAEIDAAGPVGEALAWLEQRRTGVVTPVSPDGRRALDTIVCLLQQQLDRVEDIEAAVTAVNKMKAGAVKEEAGSGTDVGRLAIAWFQKASSSSRQQEKPLMEIELQYYNFAHDWHL